MKVQEKNRFCYEGIVKIKSSSHARRQVVLTSLPALQYLAFQNWDFSFRRRKLTEPKAELQMSEESILRMIHMCNKNTKLAMKIMHIQRLSPDMTVTQASKYRNISVIRNQVYYFLLHQICCFLLTSHRNIISIIIIKHLLKYYIFKS